ncbi:MAG: InlB B-repeat-containing protein, partial [Ginsengibacter sp.]
MRKKTYSLRLERKQLAGIRFIAFLFSTILLQTSSLYAQSSSLVTNITSTTGRSYILGDLVTGVTIYTDRTYQTTSVPPFLNNAPFIRTPNDDKANNTASMLSFNLTQSATLYVAYDPRVTVLPAWLSSWQKLAAVQVVGINDPTINHLDLYSKSYAAGPVTLGGNLASPAAGSKNNYLVVALAAQTYALTITAIGNGTITKNPDLTTFPGGSNVTLTATADAGQQFTGWSGDASGTVNPLTITMNSDKSVTATFASITQYTVTLTPNGSGTVSKSPDQPSYTTGASVTLTATPSAGQQFTGWSGDANSTVNPLDITVNGDKNITGSFAPLSSSLITNISATSGRSYILGALVVGTTLYTDRTYQATSVPAFLNNASFIKTPNDDKTSTASSLLSFDLTQNATLYIAYDPRGTTLPAWLNGWQKVASQVGINDPAISYMNLYSKDFIASHITLGG